MAQYLRKLNWNWHLMNLLTNHIRRWRSSLWAENWLQDWGCLSSGMMALWTATLPLSAQLCFSGSLSLFESIHRCNTEIWASSKLSMWWLELVEHYLSFTCFICMNSLVQYFYSVRKEIGEIPVKRNCSYNYFIIIAIFKSLTGLWALFVLFNSCQKEIIGISMHCKGRNMCMCVHACVCSKGWDKIKLCLQMYLEKNPGDIIMPGRL